MAGPGGAAGLADLADAVPALVIALLGVSGMAREFKMITRTALSSIAPARMSIGFFMTGSYPHSFTA